MAEPRPFSEACLATIHLMKAAHVGLDRMAYVTGRSPQDCDRASWAMVGRSIPAAVAALNRPQPVERAHG